tara:strand:+ start:138 stop:716 length:579 start_codon:yes stop_codon:yes gene_type:complete
MKKISLVLVLMSTMFSFSQSEFQIELNLGYAFQREMILNDENLDNKSAFGLRFGVNYLKMFNDKLYMETGLYGKYNNGSREIETLSFTFNSLNIQLPLHVGYKMNDTWKFSLGASIENNKEKLDFSREDNLRYDFLTKLTYSYNTKIELSFFTNWMINSTPDTFTVSSPKNGVYLGMIYQLWKIKKAKEDKL